MSNDLPPDVLEAVHAGRKVEAIKRLREHRGMGLKEAKEAVDDYARKNRHLIVVPQSTGSGKLFVVVVVSLIGYAIYRWISQ